MLPDRMPHIYFCPINYITSDKIDYNPSPPLSRSLSMAENKLFKFTETTPAEAPDQQFKRQRKAYLAERNLRKKQAHFRFRKDHGKSSSSESEQEQRQKQPVALRQKLNTDAFNTDSSKTSNQIDTDFKGERERYRAERLAYRQELINNKKEQFGSSSSEEKESVPVHPVRPVVAVRPTPIKIKIIPENKAVNSPKVSYYNEDSLVNFNFSPLQANKTAKDPSNQPPSARLRPQKADKKFLRERYQVQTPSKKGLNIWIEQYLQIRQNSLDLYDRSFPLYDTSKIKLLFTATQSGCLKLKLNYKQEEVYFAVNYKKMNEHCLDHYYLIFAKLIMLKLQLMGKKINPYSKGKIGLSEQIIKGAQMTGRVRKASFFGGWEEKIGVVNNAGLSIFKQGKQKANIVIAYGTVRQLWTRFDFDSENLIVKFLHNNTKIELSIPLQNYLSRQNWLFHIYNLSVK